MMYTREDIASVVTDDDLSVFVDDEDGSFYIDLKDGAKCNLPYSDISDEDWKFLAADAKEYKDKLLDLLVKYINQCDVIREVEE